MPARHRKALAAVMAQAITDHMLGDGPKPPCHLVSYRDRFVTAAIDHPSPVRSEART